MVLHLLQKKSWNVYNSDNVERVRRDEAEAQAREDAEEQRLQEEDAARRIAILRGEKPPAPLVLESNQSEERQPRRPDSLPRKRRRLRGEDDTDRDIRYAKEDAEIGQKAKQALVAHDDGDAPLHDSAGNIQLIPAPDEKAIRKAEKNAEAEAEKAKKRKRDEDQYTMRFSNAAGFKNGMEKPWYAASSASSVANNATALAHLQDKDVWGNEDPLRKERERSRISGSDPLAAMQQAQRQLKRSEKDREKCKTEQEAEIEELRRSDARKQRHQRRHKRREDDEDSLEGFSLAKSSESRHRRSDHDRHRRRHHRRHRSRSRSRERHRHESQKV